MRLSVPAACIAATLVFAGVLAAETATADSILAGAQAQAQANQRAIFVVFHASW